MSYARLMAAPERANDAGGRCAVRRSGDAHRQGSGSYRTRTSCASAPRADSADRGAQAVLGATPQSEGLLRVRGQVCLRTPVPSPSGRSQPAVPCGKVSRHRFEAVDHASAALPLVGTGCACPAQCGSLPAKDRLTGASPEGGWDGSAHPNPPRATLSTEIGGSLRSRLQVLARHRDPGDRSTTARPPATCGIGGVPIRNAFPRTSTPVSHVVTGHAKLHRRGR